MSNENKTLTSIPAELKNQLPIFQVIGDKLPAAVKSIASNKTVAKIFYGSLLIGGSFWFFRNIDTLLTIARKGVWFVVYSIVLIVLLLLAPKIISVLHRLGNILLFKTEKTIVRRNPIEALQMLLNDAKDTLKRVKEKISHVDGVRIDMIQNGTQSQNTAEEKYNLVKRLTAETSKIETQAGEAQGKGNTEQANDLNREAKEMRTKAFLLGKEGEAEEHNARNYAQYANQFAKVMEVLKDNESAAKIYVSTLDSSISILQKKMEATQKMKNATEGLADVFNIKDGWVFQEAMSAATQAISQNIASIRSNLEFLDQNNNITVGGAPSQAELEDFVRKVDQRNLTKLNVSVMGQAEYDLKPEEKTDKGFSLLN
jgi:hypothetical protein